MRKLEISFHQTPKNKDEKELVIKKKNDDKESLVEMQYIIE